MLGFAAPIIFMISFFSNIISLQLIKYKLLYIYKRPTPRNAKTIGSFKIFINFIGTASIVINAIVFSITLMNIESEHVKEFEEHISEMIVLNSQNTRTLAEEAKLEEIKRFFASEVHHSFLWFIYIFLALTFIKVLFEAFIGDLNKNFKIISLRHNQIKNKIFAMTSKSNLDFARAGVCLDVPESNEDQINNLNKLRVFKNDKNLSKITEDDLTTDIFFRNKGVTNSQYDRIIEILCKAALKGKDLKKHHNLHTKLD